MANKFTKLITGDAVASGSGRAWKKLSAESEKEHELVGTWLFNNTVNNIDTNLDFLVYSYDNYNYYKEPYGKRTSAFGTKDILNCMAENITEKPIYYGIRNDGGNSILFAGQGSIGMATMAGYTIEFYPDIADSRMIVEPVFVEWLKANATKIDNPATSNGDILTTADGYILTDTNGLIITAKE